MLMLPLSVAGKTPKPTSSRMAATAGLLMV